MLDQIVAASLSLGPERHATIGRVDHQRSPTAPDDLIARTEPKRVDGPRTSAHGQRFGTRHARRISPLQSLQGPALGGQGVCFGDELRLARAALERGDGGVVPESLQVRLTVGGPWGHPRVRIGSRLSVCDRAAEQSCRHEGNDEWGGV